MTYNRQYADNIVRLPWTTGAQTETDVAPVTPVTPVAPDPVDQSPNSAAPTSSTPVGGTGSSTTRAHAREDDDATALISGSTSATHARESDEEDTPYAEYLRVCAYYRAALGAQPGPVVQRDIIEAQRAGVTGAVIVHCIAEAEVAQRPSWAYARAVLRRCMAGHILTEEDWQRDRAQWRRASAAPGREAGRFAQRTYTQAEYDAVFIDLEREDD